MVSKKDFVAATQLFTFLKLFICGLNSPYSIAMWEHQANETTPNYKLRKLDLGLIKFALKFIFHFPGGGFANEFSFVSNKGRKMVMSTVDSRQPGIIGAYQRPFDWNASRLHWKPLFSVYTIEWEKNSNGHNTYDIFNSNAKWPIWRKIHNEIEDMNHCTIHLKIDIN